MNYIDDWLILAHSHSLAVRHRDIVLTHIKELGLRLNAKKSELSLLQWTTFLNIKYAYKAVALSHLGLCDHLSLSLTPAYTPLIRTTKTCTTIIKTWPEGALTQLHSKEDLEKYTETAFLY